MRPAELPPPCESKLPPVTDPVDRAGDVWTRLEQRRGELAARAAAAELGIEDVALVAVGVAEVQALLRRHVEAIARHVLAQPVPAVGREVELLRHRMPVEAHAVAHA